MTTINSNLEPDKGLVLADQTPHAGKAVEDPKPEPKAAPKKRAPKK